MPRNDDFELNQDKASMPKKTYFYQLNRYGYVSQASVNNDESNFESNFLSGCSFIIRRDVLNKLGEPFNLSTVVRMFGFIGSWGEDIYLSRLLKVNGFRIGVSSTSVTYHFSGFHWTINRFNFFKNMDAKIYKAEKIQTHGGSLRIYVSKNKKVKIHYSVKEILKEEDKFGIKNFQTYKNFESKILQMKRNVRNNLNKLLNTHNEIVGYGSPAKATTALNYFGISKEIKYIIEDNKLKHGKFIPGVKIPIISKKNLKTNPKCILVLAWNFFDEIKNKNQALTKNFVSISDLKKSS